MLPALSHPSREVPIQQLLELTDILGIVLNQPLPICGFQDQRATLLVVQGPQKWVDEVGHHRSDGFLEPMAFEESAERLETSHLRLQMFLGEVGQKARIDLQKPKDVPNKRLLMPLVVLEKTDFQSRPEKVLDSVLPAGNTSPTLETGTEPQICFLG